MGSLLDSWEMLVVTLGNIGLKGEYLSLETLKSSLLNEEVCRKDKESVTDRKALVIVDNMTGGEVGIEVH